MRRPLVTITALALVAAASVLSAAPVSQASPRRATCGATPYSYAGLMGERAVFGVATTLTASAPAVVRAGHVAGWVGVGGPGLGPNGTDEWIQVGFNSVPGSGNRLYYEIARPGATPQYHESPDLIPWGESRRVAVLEIAGKPGWWKVWVDGKVVSLAVNLPGSHGAWQGVATAESWNAGSGACNGYTYRFKNVSVANAPGGSWRPIGSTTVIRDAGHKLTRTGASTFTARGGVS